MENEKSTLQPRNDFPLAGSKEYRINHLKLVAHEIAGSEMFPHFRGDQKKRAANIFSLLLLAASEGLHPMEAIRRYHVIEGMPTKRADAILAEFRDRGGKVRWLHRSNEKVEAEFYDPKDPKAPPVKITWTFEEAKKSGLAIGREGRLKDNWRKFPRQMLTARVISEGVRLVAPEIIVGLYTPEEVMDFDDIKPVEVKVDPEPTQSAPHIIEPKTTNNKKGETKESIHQKIRDKIKELGYSEEEIPNIIADIFDNDMPIDLENLTWKQCRACLVKLKNYPKKPDDFPENNQPEIPNADEAEIYNGDKGAKTKRSPRNKMVSDYQNKHTKENLARCLLLIRTKEGWSPNDVKEYVSSLIDREVDKFEDLTDEEVEIVFKNIKLTSSDIYKEVINNA